jgi:hypothetical protein
MPDRQAHQLEVRGFLQTHFSITDWTVSLPRGSGMETYLAQGNGEGYFVKVGAPTERYVAMADIGLTPPVLTVGELETGASIIVQPLMEGRMPSRRDYRNQMEEVAALIRKMHHHPRVQAALPRASSASHREAGSAALYQLRQKWERHKAHVPNEAGFVDESLEYLDRQVNLFSTEGLVASHNDICNANWLFASDGKIYLIDFESMAMDDPALDLGALLWWYYPPALRQGFLDIAGYPYDDDFRVRMRVRMAMHCLSITLPRQDSFDSFSHDTYGKALEDFKAILVGKENPQGYQ